MINKNMLKELTKDLKKEFADREDTVQDVDNILRTLKHSSPALIASGRKFSVVINEDGFVEMETSFSNQKISITWIEKLNRIFKIVDSFNVDVVEWNSMTIKG
jgi:hypothetical protein